MAPVTSSETPGIRLLADYAINVKCPQPPGNWEIERPKLYCEHARRTNGVLCCTDVLWYWWESYITLKNIKHTQFRVRSNDTVRYRQTDDSAIAWRASNFATDFLQRERDAPAKHPASGLLLLLLLVMRVPLLVVVVVVVVNFQRSPSKLKPSQNQKVELRRSREKDFTCQQYRFVI